MIKHLPNTKQRARRTWRAAGFRFILPGLIAPLLFTAAAFGQCGWPVPVKRALVPIRFTQKAAPASRGYQPPGSQARDDSGVTAVQEAPGADSGLPPANLKPSHRHRADPNSPLPPASAFGLQTNLRRYLETWPTPQTTVTDDCPDYVIDSDDDLH
jgi:hypothetical protein